MKATMARPTSAFVDAKDRDAVPFRNLLTSVDLSVARRGSVALLFTGSHSGDGTSTVASNQALVSSAVGRSTLLIDANLYRPGLHQRLGMESRPGLSDVAAHVISLEDAIRTTTVGGVPVSFLPAGLPGQGTSDVLSSRATAELISDACRLYDTVIIDSSPVLTMNDAAVVAAHPEVDTVVVVARHQRRKRVTATVSQLRRAGANIIGLAINSR